MTFGRLVEQKTRIYHAAMATTTDLAPAHSPKRSLVGACLAHALHDGYTDGLYAFLPVWQAQFGLSYAALALVRALYYATMGALQVPANAALRGRSPRFALVLSTLLAAAGLAVVALPLGFAGLCVGLVIAGLGSSIQHPRASTLVTDTYAHASKGPLGVYNFSGDLGKATVPALVALLLPVLGWHAVLWLLVGLGAAACIALATLAPTRQTAATIAKGEAHTAGRGGFAVLTLIGALDTAVRMGYLLFLPFLIVGKGGATTTTGMALALLFIGGALGKATCSWLGERFGTIGCVVATELTTAVLIVATLAAPLSTTLVLLPLLGVVLNGTSSVLYGAVPDLARGDTSRAFAIFYTAVIGAGGLAPIAFGAVADHAGRTAALLATAITALTILPLVVMLRSPLQLAKA